MKDEFILIIAAMLCVIAAFISHKDIAAFIASLFVCTAFIVRALDKLANK